MLLTLKRLFHKKIFTKVLGRLDEMFISILWVVGFFDIMIARLYMRVRVARVHYLEKGNMRLLIPVVNYRLLGVVVTC